MMNSLGLVGFGRFGQLLYRFLRDKYHITIYDPHQQRQPHFENFPFAELEEVCYNPLVILAVPISAIDGVARIIKPYLRPETIVMDVCSVKKYPLEILESNLPTSVDLIGSHPLFGPESVSTSLKGHRVVLVPVRSSTQHLNQITIFWSDLGVKVFEMNPDEHDYIMAWTLALTHYLGRGLTLLPLPKTKATTKGYRALLKIVENVNKDTEQLFEDMHRFNPYTAKMRKNVIEALRRIDRDLEEK